MDSLRYWLTEMHVDGFRFDLAATLARQEGGFSPMSAFFDLVAQDPVVSQAKLIAEPWDVGQLDSYDLGRFPVLWHEWNGRYRDSMRDFWRSQKTGIGEFATRFAGSSDLYGDDSRTPCASVNLITVHDGFTLRDLVSYDTKHNEANGEANRDGTSDNRSWNCGAEGPTPAPEVQALRARQSRAMLSHAAAVVRHPAAARRRRAGPDPERQQQRVLPGQRDLLVRLVRRGRGPAVVHRRPGGVPARAPGVPPALVPDRREAAELGWFTPAGTAMTSGDWSDPNALALGIYLDGSDAPAPGRGRAPRCSTTTSWSWSTPGGSRWTSPSRRPGQAWQLAIDSYDPQRAAAAAPPQAGDRVTVGPRSVCVLRGPRDCAQRRNHA